MRVEATNTELRGDEKTSEAPRARHSKFRQALRRCRRHVNASDSMTEQSTRSLERPRVDARPSSLAPVQGAPSRGLERVSRVDDAVPATPRIAGLSATITTHGHSSVDLMVRTGPDGILVSLAAAPSIAERMSATVGALGRRLSVRSVKARSIRVASKATEHSSNQGGSGR